MKRKSILLFAILLSSYFNSFAIEGSADTLYIASWNMENLFDTVDDAGKRDGDFTPEGKKEWTQDKIDVKLENQAKVLKWMNDGKGPDLLGFQEVEHQALIDTLLQRYFNNRNYKVAYAESPDKRGIDNGLIYDADNFSLLSIKTLEVKLPSKYPTRYILEVHLKEIKNNSDLFVFVNHWPSRGGGELKSRPNRKAVALVLRNELDNLYIENDSLNVIIVGDFNDELDNLSIARYLWVQGLSESSRILPNRLYDLSFNEYLNGLGTYLYRGDWNMLDHIIVSGELLQSGKIKYLKDSFELIKPDFMITQSGKYKGAATPTYGGRKYIGGYSDHIPVGARFIFKN